MSDSAPPPAATRLTVDLDALVGNWRTLQAFAPAAETAAMVKADAYGLGADRVVPALARAGCRTFFAAFPDEALAVREAAPGARVFVLAGLFEETAMGFIEHRLVPVLNRREDLAVWRRTAARSGRRLACALHFDTGMNRLGLAVDEAGDIAAAIAAEPGLEPALVMSHLACADEPGHRLNAAQKARFDAVRARFPGVAASLANSAAILTDPGFAYDLTRPGIALYGGEAVNRSAGPMMPVATFEARILQLRRARKGETVGYGATTTLARDSVLAIAGVGYADGYLRAASGAGVPQRQLGAGASGAIAGRPVPVVGRISMDATAFDVTDLPDRVLASAAWIELIGETIGLDDFARAAGTIGYEVLTRIGPRAERRYVGGGTTPA
ncbi:MAG: alanine racemase, biosynthetic [Alphaproteobacteria bacterium]|nr:MAG: alanine racemase, biosynthetic [Alphaproteobacteria bacterium]